MSSARFDLISNLNTPSITKKYQVFEVEMGFEKASVLIPLDTADSFEKEAARVKPKTVTTLNLLAIPVVESVERDTPFSIKRVSVITR